MNLESLAVVVAVAANFILSILIALHLRRSRSGKYLFFTLLGFTGWTVSNYFSNLVTSEAGLYWWNALIFTTTAVGMWALLFFVDAFPDDAPSNKKLFIAFNTVFAATFVVSLTPYLVGGARMNEQGISVIDFGWGIALYGIFVISCLAVAFVKIFKKYFFAKDASTKKVVRLLIAGVGMFLFLAITTNLLLPVLFGSYEITKITPVYVSVFGFMLFWAILRYKFLNIKVITTEMLSFAIWMFLLAQVIFADSTGERLANTVLLAAVVFFGIFLIRSVLKEVKQKEQIETLAKGLSKANGELADLNTHLEEKVKEQTIEIRRAYEVEKKAKEELLALDKAKTDFILTTQHHLRTPLTVVRAAIKSLTGKKEGETLSQMDVSFLQKSDTASETLAKLVNEFLDISQMEVGKSILDKKPTSLHPLIAEVTEELKHEWETKHIEITANFDDAAKNTTVLLDAKKMRDALLNVIDNAIKYTPQGGKVMIEGGIGIHPIEKTKLYRLTVSDTGIGMTAEEIEKVFTRSFERGARAKELYATGRGLGLMLAKQIITSHNGTIQVGSKGENKGTTFTIDLPVEG